MSSESVARALAALRARVEAHIGMHGSNALADPEWHALCDVVLRATEAWSYTHARAADAIAYLEDLGSAPWYRAGRISARRVLFEALQDNMPARIAVAEALSELSREER